MYPMQKDYIYYYANFKNCLDDFVAIVPSVLTRYSSTVNGIAIQKCLVNSIFKLKLI